MIGLAKVINYIDRSAINIMWPYIYKDFGIADGDNKNALALLTTFFMVASWKVPDTINEIFVQV